jgi:hypothetical protein
MAFPDHPRPAKSLVPFAKKRERPRFKVAAVVVVAAEPGDLLAEPSAARRASDHAIPFGRVVQNEARMKITRRSVTAT